MHNLVAEGKVPSAPALNNNLHLSQSVFTEVGRRCFYLCASLHCGYHRPHRPSCDRRVKMINEANSPFLPHNEDLDVGMFL